MKVIPHVRVHMLAPVSVFLNEANDMAQFAKTLRIYGIAEMIYHSKCVLKGLRLYYSR